MVLGQIVAATLLVSFLSLICMAFLVLGKERMERIMLLLVGFSAGAILGATFFDLLPESIGALGAGQALFAAFAGIIAAFAMEKIVHLHHHHHVDHEGEHAHPLGALVLVGGGTHAFLDGVAIAAGFIASAQIGIATTAAVIFHELPHGIGNFSLFLYSGCGKERAVALNFLTALSSVAGGVLFFLFSGAVSGIVPYALAFTAGTFIYIAAADLFPELHKEKNPQNSALQLFAVLAGAAIIWLVAGAAG